MGHVGCKEEASKGGITAAKHLSDGVDITPTA